MIPCGYCLPRIFFTPYIAIAAKAMIKYHDYHCPYFYITYIRQLSHYYFIIAILQTVPFSTSLVAVATIYMPLATFFPLAS